MTDLEKQQKKEQLIREIFNELKRLQDEKGADKSAHN